MNGTVDRVVRRFAEETVGPSWPAARALVDRGYADIELLFQRLEVPALAGELAGIWLPHEVRSVRWPLAMLAGRA